MNRRTYLARYVAPGLAIALAGCTEQSLEAAKEKPPWIDPYVDEEEIELPTTQKYGITAEAVERAEGETFEDPEEFEAYLEEAGLAVESLGEKEEHGETILELEYVVEEAIEEGNARSVGAVAGGYAALVRGGYDGDELEASILGPDGAKFGEFEILTERAEEYNDGEKSAATYGGEAVHTLESKR